VIAFLVTASARVGSELTAPDAGRSTASASTAAVVKANIEATTVALSAAAWMALRFISYSLSSK
jgi:hypothetical protein